MCSLANARRLLRVMIIAGLLGGIEVPPYIALISAQEQFATDTPTTSEISQALEKVKRDPNLATERTIRMLRWQESGNKSAQPDLAWFAWIMSLFRWMGQSARLLVWGSAFALAAWIVIYVMRAVAARQALPAAETFVAPTHVRDLDIRPESLPADIGASARRLWDRGDHRAALALLYRGLLSRLTHVHRVPIRDSSTEGDCLSLAAGHAPQASSRYTSRLVVVWQSAVYGGADTTSAIVHALCDDFAGALDRRLPAESARGTVA